LANDATCDMSLTSLHVDSHIDGDNHITIQLNHTELRTTRVSADDGTTKTDVDEMVGARRMLRVLRGSVDDGRSDGTDGCGEGESDC
jgi:hypothetical protein